MGEVDYTAQLGLEFFYQLCALTEDYECDEFVIPAKKGILAEALKDAIDKGGIDALVSERLHFLYRDGILHCEELESMFSVGQKAGIMELSSSKKDYTFVISPLVGQRLFDKADFYDRRSIELLASRVMNALDITSCIPPEHL